MLQPQKLRSLITDKISHIKMMFSGKVGHKGPQLTHIDQVTMAGGGCGGSVKYSRNSVSEKERDKSWEFWQKFVSCQYILCKLTEFGKRRACPKTSTLVRKRVGASEDIGWALER